MLFTTCSSFSFGNIKKTETVVVWLGFGFFLFVRLFGFYFLNAVKLTLLIQQRCFKINLS